MSDPDDPERQTMASRIISAIDRHSIPYDCLTGQELWEKLQRKGYRFPVSGRRLEFLHESARWSDALDLAIKRLKSKTTVAIANYFYFRRLLCTV